MAAEKPRGGLGRGLAALIPSSPAQSPRLGDSAADIVLGGNSRSRAAAEALAAEALAQEAQSQAQKPKRASSAKKSGGKQSTKPAAKKTANAKKAAEKTTGATKSASKRKAAEAPKPAARGPKGPKTSGGVAGPNMSALMADAERAGQVDSLPTVGDIGATYREIPIGEIIPNPRQPRQVFDEEAMAELVHSIKEFGLMQPIVVRRSDSEDAYEIIMGERRWRASAKAGLHYIPAIIRDTSDDNLLRDALLENIHRVQLNPLEEAAAYQQLLEEFDVTQAELADRLGRSRPVITNMIRLLSLPVSVQRKVASGVLSAGHARALLGLKVGGAAQKEELADRIVAEGLSVRATEEAVTLLNRGDGPQQRAKKSPIAQPEFASRAAERLADVWDTRVTVSVGKRKGKIVVEFSDEQDLDRILGLINKE